MVEVNTNTNILSQMFSATAESVELTNNKNKFLDKETVSFDKIFDSINERINTESESIKQKNRKQEFFDTSKKDENLENEDNKIQDNRISEEEDLQEQNNESESEKENENWDKDTGKEKNEKEKAVQIEGILPKIILPIWDNLGSPQIDTIEDNQEMVDIDFYETELLNSQSIIVEKSQMEQTNSLSDENTVELEGVDEITSNASEVSFDNVEIEGIDDAEILETNFDNDSQFTEVFLKGDEFLQKQKTLTDELIVDDIESIELIENSVDEVVMPVSNSVQKELKMEMPKLNEQDTVIEEVEPTTDFSTDTDDDNQQLNQGETNFKLSADNMIEKSAFLNSDKSIIFNKILDNATTVSAMKTPSKTEVLSQVNQGLSSLTNENTKINIILKPENLGRINVELQTGKDGLVAKFGVETPQLKEMLDKSIESLKNTLSNQGVNVNHVTVKIETTTGTSNSNLQNYSNENFEQNMSTNSQQQNSTKSNQNQKENIESTAKEDMEVDISSDEKDLNPNSNLELRKIDYRI